MSRIANYPIALPEGVEVRIDGDEVFVKGGKGELRHRVHSLVQVEMDENVLKFRLTANSKAAVALSGTTRAIVQNLVKGVSEGFERKLSISGIGYRAQVQDRVLNLTLGFSHPVNFEIPDGISIETPSQTEVVVRGIDKQQVGQVAADIRSYRPPEPYKGKGVRYVDEYVIRKEAKKA